MVVRIVYCNCIQYVIRDTNEMFCLLFCADRGALQWPSDDGVRQVQEACWELLFLPVAERLRQRLHIEDTTGIIPVNSTDTVCTH